MIKMAHDNKVTIPFPIDIISWNVSIVTSQNVLTKSNLHSGKSHMMVEQKTELKQTCCIQNTDKVIDWVTNLTGIAVSDAKEAVRQ